ncbi:Bone morphogenetic protein 1 [Holothuria leucospilota]|uniref:Bone morphogenetic protein 1 n=1 Tax=Holothuria leucospilota TaxID=206669 RepID=A0A9Q0YKZ5_HOLLE|nr:Bone morphogenetic protein 1 [Holothuria leucospilota]
MHFHLPVDHRLRIEIQSFDIERGNNRGNCIYDYVEIYDGTSSQAPLFGRWCGQSSPPVIISSNSRLFMLFVSDGSVQESGFSATITMVDNTHVEDVATPDPNTCYKALDGETGLFSSPGYPEKYINHLDCVYVITTNEESTLQMRFLSFDVEPSVNCVYDYVEVRDGSTTVAPVLGRYCGGAGNGPPDIIESEGSSLYILFHTDYSERFTGFNAEYIISSIGFPSIGSDGDSNSGITVCDGTIVTTAKSGVIVSHDVELSNSYLTQQTCHVIISGDRPDEKVYINVVQNDLSPPDGECGEYGDYLEIDTEPVTKLCERDRGHFTTDTSQASIRFTSDEVSNGNHNGFKIIYAIFYEDQYGCDEGYFMCSNDRCILQELACDGYNHCDDNSDELGGACSEGIGAVWVLIVLAILASSCCFCCCFGLLVKVTTKSPSQSGNRNGTAVVFANIDPPPYSVSANTPTATSSSNYGVPPAPSNIYSSKGNNNHATPPPVVQASSTETPITALGTDVFSQPPNNRLPPLQKQPKP